MNTSSRRQWFRVGVIAAVGLGSAILARAGLDTAETNTGLQKFTNCTLVPTDWADGDSFRIALEGGLLMTVRLYGADCLEWHVNDPSDARRLRAQRRYFGISETGENVGESIAMAKDLGHRAALRVGELLTEQFTAYTAGADARGSDGSTVRKKLNWPRPWTSPVRILIHVGLIPIQLPWMN